MTFDWEQALKDAGESIAQADHADSDRIKVERLTAAAWALLDVVRVLAEHSHAPRKPPE